LNPASNSVSKFLLIRSILFYTAVLIFTVALNAQEKKQPGELSINLEIRPRAEYRNNYKMSSAEKSYEEFYVSQRNRLSISYQKNKWLFHSSFQEIHLWGKDDKFSSIGNINFYEAFVEPKISRNLSLRVGRQRLLFDNGRLFSDAPWAQQSRSHEAVRLLYNRKNLSSDIALATTRKYSAKYDESYSPVASHRYKLLAVHHLKYKFDDHFTLTTLNYIDIFKNAATGKNYHFFTTGGRLEYLNKKFYLTVNAFYQAGKTSTQKKLSAYYIQPEMRYSFSKTVIRFGAEILSGEKDSLQGNTAHTFNIFYGVAWKFMGNMNFFTRFPADVNGKGLVNPYLFILQEIDNKFSVRADFHLFYTQYPITNLYQRNRYLGFESDLSLNYKPRKDININFGLSWYSSHRNMLQLRKIESVSATPIWSYFMISYSPQLYHSKK
jgi:hypothetical protein